MNRNVRLFLSFLKQRNLIEEFERRLQQDPEEFFKDVEPKDFVECAFSWEGDNEIEKWGDLSDEWRQYFRAVKVIRKIGLFIFIIVFALIAEGIYDKLFGI